MAEWIPTKERLPEYDEDYVLVTVETIYWTRLDIAKRIDRQWYASNGLRIIDSTVTAWMPLPEPYEGSENDG